MSTKPLVSTIVAFLDAERFIEEAVESVFAQTYDNWELLLVDDGSADGSTEVALRYAERNPGRVRYLEHPGHQNRGVSASRNLGINRARGEHVAFLDADDVWLPHHLKRQIAILSEYPQAGMVYGSSQWWYSWTGKPEDTHRDFRDFVEKLNVSPNTLLKPPALLTVFLRNGRAVPPPCSTMMRREVVKGVGGFEEEFRLYEDQVLYVKVGLRTPVFVAGECWSRYRQHPDSNWYVAQKAGQVHSARLFFLNWLAEYLSEQGVEDTEVWGLLRQEQLVVKVRLYRQEREWKRAVWGSLVLVWRYPRGFFVRAWRKVRRLLAVSAAG